MEEKALETLLYLGTKQFNLTEDELKPLITDEEGKLKDDAADILLEKDKERIAKLKKDRELKYNEGYQTAEKKFKTHAEEVFKKKTGYDGTEENFEAMFDNWFAKQKEQLAKKKEVNDDDIKRHPLYIDLESKSIAKDKYDELQRAFNEFKTQSQRKAVMDTVTGRAWDIVAARNPILSENPTVAENRRRDFLSKFSAFDYDLQDEKIVVLRDGKRLEDAHGNLKTFEAFTVEMAELNFDFRAQDDKGNSGNKNKTGDTVVITDKPTTEAEYIKAMDKWDGSSEEHAKMRVALKKYYFENKKD